MWSKSFMYAKRLDFYLFLILSMVIVAIILKFRLLCLISAVHHSDCYTYIYIYSFLCPFPL